MKLQARFLLVYGFLFAIVAALLVIQHLFDLDRSHFVLQNELKQRQSYFTQIAALESRPLNTLSVDYSFWDDMVTFVKQGNKDLQFATDNIDTGLGTYNADAAWVYRPDDTLVYFKSNTDDPTQSQLDLPKGFFQKLYKDQFEHFFIREPDGLLEIRAATIVSGDDPDHKTTPQGFWIVGRFMNSDVITNLGHLTQSTVKLEPASASAAGQLGTNSVTFSQTLSGWEGQPVARLSSTSAVSVVDDLRTLYYRQLLLLLFFTMASILVIVLSIWQLILKPMRLISRSITAQQPAQLDVMAATKTEFGNLARTVQQFYQQKITIQESEFIKNKLVELNQAKGEFLAIAAHELKGPVGNVHLFAENLTDLVKDDAGTAQLLTEVERISQQARKATILINDMYQASKGGQYLEVNRTEFNFDTFIRQEIDNAQYSTHQKIELEGATGHNVISDSDRLSQVVTNLIRNAAKYSPLTGVITVRLSYADNEAVVEVADTGIGISAEDQSHIFERFFRSKEVATSYPGLGLGLSVCHEIIAALGGRIWLESETDHGSHFFFSLPVSPGERELA